MTYAASGLVSFAQGAKSTNLWHYVTDDTLAVVVGANYFNSAAHLLRVGDLIFVSADLDGTAASETYVVASNNGTTVAVTAAS